MSYIQPGSRRRFFRKRRFLQSPVPTIATAAISALPILLFISCFTHAAQSTGAPVAHFVFDLDTGASCAANAVYVPLTGYLVLSQLDSSRSLAGWEMTIDVDDGLFLTPEQLFGEGLNVRANPEFQVGLRVPQVPASTVVVARFSVFAANPGEIRLGPLPSPSVPHSHCAAIAYADDPGELHSVTLPNAMCAGYAAAIEAGLCDSSEQYVPTPTVQALNYSYIYQDTMPTPTSHYAQYPYSSQGRGFGYNPVEHGPYKYGVRDFLVLPSGQVVVLDSINNAVVVLSDSLTWVRAYPLPRDRSPVDRIWYAEQQLCVGNSHEMLYCLEHDRFIALDTPAPVCIPGARCVGEAPVDYVVHSYGTNASVVEASVPLRPGPQLKQIYIDHQGALSGLVPLGASTIQGQLLVAIYTRPDRPGVPHRGQVICVPAAGTSLRTIDLPAKGNFTMRTDLRVGCGGAIVMIAMREEYVEVFRWGI